MVAGLLSYSRDGKRILLCAALFSAPLLHYGLVLFGFGVLGAAVIFPEPRSLGEGLRRRASDTRQGVVWHWLNMRIGLLWPAVCFLAGCAITWWLTLRFHQREEGEWWYIEDFFFEGKYTLGSIAEFTASRTLMLLRYHLLREAPKEIVALVIFGVIICVLVFRSCRRACFNPVIVLFLFAIAIANLAALRGAYTFGSYPLGPIRQNIYLGPVIFLATASVFYAVVYLPAQSLLSAQSLRGWLRPALLLVTVVAIVYVGAREFDENVFDKNNFGGSWGRKQNYVSSALDALDEQIQAGDVVYMSNRAGTIAKFYHRQKKDNWIYSSIYGACDWKGTAEECLADIFENIKPETKRLWLLILRGPPFDYESLELVDSSIGIEQPFAIRQTQLWLITNPYLLKESQDRIFEVVPGLGASAIS